MLIILLIWLNFVSSFAQTQSTYKIYSNKKLNQNEWLSCLIKTYKPLDQLLCIIDCSRINNCKLASYNKLNNECKYYSCYLNNQTNLIESTGDFVYDYEINRYTYQLQGIQVVSISTGYCRVHSLISLPNGNFASGCDTGHITVLSKTNWNSIIIFNHGTCVDTLAIMQNKYLISGGYGNNLKVWDYITGKLMNTFSGIPSGIRSTIVLNNGDLVTASSVEFTAKIWNPTTGKIKFILNEPSYINGIVELKNGSVLTISGNGNIKIWDPFTGNLIRTKNIAYYHTAIAYLKNDDLLIGDNVGGLRIFDSTTYQLKFNLIGHTGSINRLIQLKNGDIASCSSDRTVRIWDWNTKMLKQNLSSYMDLALIELQNGYVVSGGLDFKLNVWK